MCYEAMISADCPTDLATFNSEDLFFENTVAEENRVHLKFQNTYRLATYAPNCCSCGLRVLDGKAFEYEFCGLQDWLGEEADDPEIINTRFLFQVIKNIVSQGYKVDCYVVWNGDEKIPPEKTLIVNVNDISEDRFMLFEGVRFNFVV